MKLLKYVMLLFNVYAFLIISIVLLKFKREFYLLSHNRFTV